jgi:putative Mg2+ transporter-C (MgtC) family protein
LHPIPTEEIMLRLLAALVCGAVVGVNRNLHRKPAGFRTFGLVSMSSAIAVLIILGVAGPAGDAMSRVIQGLLTGIGFIGAGVILHREPKGKVIGLTTAAAVWLTAGLGMAAGVGQYRVAFLGLAFSLTLLIGGGPIERALGRVFKRRPRLREPPAQPPQR